MMTATQDETQSKMNSSSSILVAPRERDLDDTNKVLAAFKQVQAAFAGEAYKTGFETEEAMQSYVKALRKQARG